MPWEYWRWEIVKTTGWTLEYIDSLDMKDLHEYMQVNDGLGKGKSSLLL